MNRNKWLVVGAFALLPFAAGAALTKTPVGRAVQDGARLFTQVLEHVQQNAVDSLTSEDIYEKAARGLIKGLNDPYADLYSPEELASFQRNTLGNNYGGIGMQIESQDGLITVVRVFPNTPGEQGGVQAGDRILRVDSTDVTGLPLDQVSGRLTGRPGTKVNVILGRLGVPEPIPATFTRAVIRVPAVPYTLLLQSGIGYLPLQRFNESASSDVAAAIRQLQVKGATSYIIDLRGNPGGSLEQSLAIGDLFVRPGLELASVRHRGKQAEVFRSQRPAVADSAPVIVLIDGFSASASEIVAGALQDHDRALVLGTSSYGKGLVQTLFPLDGGWAMKLTTGKWYTPSGRSIQGEHTQLNDGRFVEYAPDTAETDASKKSRPVFHSDAGRVIYGGGGITPDLIVRADSATAAEQEFLRTVAPQSQQMILAISNVARDLKARIKPDFILDAQWRELLWQKMQEQKIGVDRQLFDKAARLLDRNVDSRLSALAFGDSTAFRRSIPSDAQMRKAIDLLKRGMTQHELLAVGTQAKTPQ